MRETYETATPPAPLLLLNDVFGPPTTRGEAGVSLAMAGIPVGKAGKVALVADDAVKYAGVRELSATLKASGATRAQRLEWIQSFQIDSITARTATPDERFVRYWGGEAGEQGRWLTRGPDLGAGARSTLALPSANTAEHATEFALKPGTRYFEGRAAPKFGHPGGGHQIFVPDGHSSLMAKAQWR